MGEGMLGGIMRLSLRRLLLAALCTCSLAGTGVSQTDPVAPVCDSACLQDAVQRSEAARARKDYAAAAEALQPAHLAGPGVIGWNWYDAMYTQACDLALAGDCTHALATLRLAQGNGGVTGAEHLRTDTDLASLHGDPAFEVLVAEQAARERLWTAEPGQQLAYTPEMSDDARVAALSTLWSEARFNFPFFDRQPGLDWNQLYLDTLPRVRAARSTADVYHVLIQFMAALHDGHSNVYAPDALQDIFYARPGLRTALVGGEVVITGIRDPALIAQGWRVGDVVLSVNGAPVQQYATTVVQPEVSASTAQDRNDRMYGSQLFMGDAGQPLRVQVRNAGGQTSERSLARLRPAEARLLPRRVDAAFLVRPDGVAVLTVNEFEDHRGSEVLLQHLAEAQAAKGLIIDVRANGGGNTDLKLLAMLANGKIPGPQQRTREYRATFRAWGMLPGWYDIPPQSYAADPEHHVAAPVAVLIGPETFSAAEDFVAAFVALHRGTTVGEPTGGSTGQPFPFKLPAGGSARICTKDDRAGDGTIFEGVGLLPDVPVGTTVADVQAGNDPVMERAAQLLLRGTPPRVQAAR